MQIRKSFLYLCLGLFLCILFSHPAHAEFKYPLLEQFPGFFNAGSTPTFPDLLSAVYKFGIWTVGIAAFFMLTVGGFLYATSAGNTASISSAKNIITDALWGLVMALAAYLLLYVINPDLVNLNLNLISVGLNTATTPGVVGGGSGSNNTAITSSGGPCTGTNSGCCKAGTKCGDCYNCTDFSNSYSRLCYKGASGSTGCKLNSTLAGKINSANLSSVGAEVSEAWPPTVGHSDPCHANGTCADVRCKNGCDNESKENIKKIYNALKSTGLKVVYEGKDCASFNAIGVYCKRYSTTTGSSFHVEM